MATEIVMVDADEAGHVKVGVWKTEDGMITVTCLGTFPSTTTQLGGSANAPESLAQMILTKFK
jgi:hypothetical protein